MSTCLPVLYSFRRCPYAMRARLALYSAKVSHEHREVNLKNKPLEMLTISPKGTVPVMILENGDLLEESLDIMKWAFKVSSLSTEDILLIRENDTTFKQALDRYKYPGRYLEKIGINYQEECEYFLRKLENQLAPFLNGNMLTLVDLAIFPFIRQFSMVNPDWFETQPYPHIQVWLNFFITNQLFKDVMQKFLFWTPENKPELVLF
ncbi:hypothetical protein IM40_04820 [Candidatus Paracaedimonas acanthamoebae]|nr:hypothetical protein IM40_04820 [Candidatus Paracaedimonas acanthamoebae]